MPVTDRPECMLLISARMGETIADLESAFDIPDYSKAKAELIRLVYWDRIDKGIKQKMHQFH